MTAELQLGEPDLSYTASNPARRDLDLAYPPRCRLMD
jgi:hypothetical protein